MDERERISRRQILTIGGMIAVAAAVTGTSIEDAAAKPAGPEPGASPPSGLSKQPCVGETGYEARVAELFHSID